VSSLSERVLAGDPRAMARAISLKDIGPIGDELAKIIDPQGDGEPVPPQAQQMIAQLQQQFMMQFDVNRDGKLSGQEQMMAQEATTACPHDPTAEFAHSPGVA